MQYSIELSTKQEEFREITGEVCRLIQESGVRNGLCLIFSPHTTAGITINENADPDVTRDMLLGLGQAYPDRPEFRHFEGNSAAHLRATAVGSGVTVIIQEGEPVLGRWQGIYFCEFDGPRRRRCLVKILSN